MCDSRKLALAWRLWPAHLRPYPPSEKAWPSEDAGAPVEHLISALPTAFSGTVPCLPSVRGQASWTDGIVENGLDYLRDDSLREGLATDYRSRRHGCVLRGD
jgi:hypothetical protein